MELQDSSTRLSGHIDLIISHHRREHGIGSPLEQLWRDAFNHTLAQPTPRSQRSQLSATHDRPRHRLCSMAGGPRSTTSRPQALRVPTSMLSEAASVRTQALVSHSLGLSSDEQIMTGIEDTWRTPRIGQPYRQGERDHDDSGREPSGAGMTSRHKARYYKGGRGQRDCDSTDPCLD